MSVIKKFDAPEDENAPGHDNTNVGGSTDKTSKGGNPHPEGTKEHKSFKEKIKDALQEWSNDNERDIEEDDNSALRSGL